MQEHFPDVVFDYQNERVGDVLTTKAQIQPFLSESSWVPKHNIDQGIRECFEKLKAELGGAGE